MSSCCTTIIARHATTVRRGTTHIQLLYSSLAASSSDGGQLFQFRDSHCRRHVHSNSKGLLNTNTVVQTLNYNTAIYYTARKSHFSTSTATTAAAVNDSNNNNGNDNVTANNENDEDESKIINDVIIIGGGPTGLLLSTLLTSYMNTTSSNNSNNNNNNINNNNNSMNGNRNTNNNNSSTFSHLLFDKRPIHQLLLHPQAHFINIRSMELLRAELPRVYNGIMKEMPPVQEWNGFHFGASVVVSSSGTDNNSNHVGGRRMARVIHPVEEPLRVGQCGDAILVPQEQQHRQQQQQQQQKHQSKDATTAATTNHGHGTIGASATTSALDTHNDVVSTCRPAHLAQNKFVKLLLEEAKRRIDDQYTTTAAATTATSTATTTDSSLLHNNDMCNASEESSSSGSSSSSAADKCLLYGQEVISISEQQQTTTTRPIITITTSTGQTHHTRYLIAADGVHSFIRKQYGIPMNGNDKMQHLLNVHFRTNDALSKVLMTNRSNNNNSDNESSSHQAMLHFIYNPQLVGVFVCHDGRKGEWVLQIPFFPPFQTMNDFTEENVKEMIWAGLGVVRPARTAGTTGASSSNDGDGDGDNNHDHVHDIDILSIRPWTMSSLVAQTYLNESKTVALVGDAAHAFPPAGGFGMNTGLQDVHNIAWRLALLLKREQRNEALPSAVSHGGESSPTSTTIATTSVPNASSFSASILAKYEQERKPIATQNAALSVRNYQRTLRIAKACYLDAQHPQLLMTLMQVPPMSFLPLQAQQTMFRQLVQVAMMPLGSLTSSLQQTTTKSFHANHIEKNVRLILESGGSLPLVFPRYELGFAYDDDTISKKTVPNASEDTAGYYPRVKVGHRLPHVVVENLMCSNGNMNGWIVVEAPNQQARGASSLCNASAAGNSADASDSLYISLVDISSQLRSASSYSTPIFTLLAVGPTLTCPTSPVHNVVESITNKFDFPLVLAHVLSERPHDKTSWNTNNPQDEVKLFVDEQQALMKVLKNEPSLSFSSECDQTDAIIMVRPDGHVAAVSWIHTAKDGDNVDEILTKIQDVIEGGYRNAMGTF